MIITRTPFRISFFGGGTDYPAWFHEHPGAVLATTIDKYCYISCRRLPQFFDHTHRVVYSKIEGVRSIDEIQHPAVRAVLKWADVKEGLEIHHDGDLPARSGLGSSSSFTVGLIHALSALDGRYADKRSLAANAIHIEQDLIGESVGSQDQVSAAYGGFNRIDFRQDGHFEVSPIIASPQRVASLQEHLMLVFTGISRLATEVASAKIRNFSSRQSELQVIYQMVTRATDIIRSPDTPIEEFGELLDEGWRYKKTLSDRVSTDEIDRLYSAAQKAGAIGGKLLGAGGGGFLLLFARPGDQPRIRECLKHLVHVPFKFEDVGSRVVLYQPQGL